MCEKINVKICNRINIYTYISFKNVASGFGNTFPSFRPRADPGWKKLIRR